MGHTALLRCSGSANWWWLRSPNLSNSTNFCNVNNNGNVGNNNNASNTNGVCLGFRTSRPDKVSALCAPKSAPYAEGRCAPCHLAKTLL
jgi:hypothetical protein